jgi:hypothetical protein
MQRASVSSRSFARSFDTRSGPLPGSRVWHFLDAALNAGDDSLIPELERLMLRLPLGSGKFETPCVRMHSENASKPLTAVDSRGLLADEPQAEIATVQPSATSDARRRRRVRRLIRDGELRQIGPF